jgi:hypothetical protein
VQLRPRSEYRNLDALSECRHGVQEDIDGVVVLPEAECISPHRRALVTLPSGNLLACKAALLAFSCSTLRPNPSALLSSVVHMEYQPSAEVWNDEEVTSFLLMLHQHDDDQAEFDLSNARPFWQPLCATLGVQGLRLEELLRVGLCKSELTVDDAWKWMAIYRQHSDPLNWKQKYLTELATRSVAHFTLLISAESREKLLSVFDVKDVLAVCYSSLRHCADGA